MIYGHTRHKVVDARSIPNGRTVLVAPKTEAALAAEIHLTDVPNAALKNIAPTVSFFIYIYFHYYVLLIFLIKERI